MFGKKKGYKDYYNTGYLKAVFEPKENLAKLKVQYEQIRPTAKNYTILKAKMAGFMAGLEARYKSRLHLLDASKSMSSTRDERER